MSNFEVPRDFWMPPNLNQAQAENLQGILNNLEAGEPLPPPCDLVEDQRLMGLYVSGGEEDLLEAMVQSIDSGIQELEREVNSEGDTYEDGSVAAELFNEEALDLKREHGEWLQEKMQRYMEMTDMPDPEMIAEVHGINRMEEMARILEAQGGPMAGTFNPDSSNWGGGGKVQVGGVILTQQIKDGLMEHIKKMGTPGTAEYDEFRAISVQLAQQLRVIKQGNEEQNAYLYDKLINDPYTPTNFAKLVKNMSDRAWEAYGIIPPRQVLRAAAGEALRSMGFVVATNAVTAGVLAGSGIQTFAQLGFSETLLDLNNLTALVTCMSNFIHTPKTAAIWCTIAISIKYGLFLRNPANRMAHKVKLYQLFESLFNLMARGNGRFNVVKDYFTNLKIAATQELQDIEDRGQPAARFRDFMINMAVDFVSARLGTFFAASLSSKIGMALGGTIRVVLSYTDPTGFIARDLPRKAKYIRVGSLLDHIGDDQNNPIGIIGPLLTGQEDMGHQKLEKAVEFIQVMNSLIKNIEEITRGQLPMEQLINELLIHNSTTQDVYDNTTGNNVTHFVVKDTMYNGISKFRDIMSGKMNEQISKMFQLILLPALSRMRGSEIELSFTERMKSLIGMCILRSDAGLERLSRDEARDIQPGVSQAEQMKAAKLYAQWVDYEAENRPSLRDMPSFQTIDARTAAIERAGLLKHPALVTGPFRFDELIAKSSATVSAQLLKEEQDRECVALADEAVKRMLASYPPLPDEPPPGYDSTSQVASTDDATNMDRDDGTNQGESTFGPSAGTSTADPFNFDSSQDATSGVDQGEITFGLPIDESIRGDGGFTFGPSAGTSTADPFNFEPDDPAIPGFGGLDTPRSDASSTEDMGSSSPTGGSISKKSKRKTKRKLNKKSKRKSRKKLNKKSKRKSARKTKRKSARKTKRKSRKRSRK